MALTEKDVRYVAELAHLELTEDEVRKFLPQLDSILQYVQKLNELDTAQAEAMAQFIPSASSASANPSLRADEVRKTFGQEEALANAPDRSAECFKVPRIIEKE